MVNEQSSASARIQDLLRSSKEIGQDYENIHFLGEGGMGTVFSGFQKGLNRKVAIKCILCQQFADENDVERFKREARVLARLEHEGIVRIYKIDERESLIFIVFEFIDGETLSSRLEEVGKFPIKEGVELVAHVARIIGFVHERGIIHRDIKGENVILLRDGGVKVIDFGLAKGHSEKSTVGDVTEMGKVLGTPQYLAPEVIKGERPSPQSDIYALAVLLFKLLSGVYPFTGGPLEILTKHLQERVPRLSLLVPGLSRSLDDLVNRALAKKASQRIQTMEEFASLLERALREKPSSARTLQMKSASPPVDGGPETKGAKWIVAPIILAFLLASLYFAFFVSPSSTPIELSLDGKSALRKSKNGYGLLLKTSTKTIIKASGQFGSRSFTVHLSKEPTNRHLLLLPGDDGLLTELRFEDSARRDLKIPIRSLESAFHKAVDDLPLKDLLFQLIKDGQAIPKSVHEAKNRKKYLLATISKNDGADRCKALVPYLPTLFQSKESSIEEKTKLFHKVMKLLPIEMAASFSGSVKLLQIEDGCAPFSKLSRVQSFSGRKLKDYPDEDNNLMPQEAYTLGVNESWDKKRRQIVSKFMVNVEQPARRHFLHTFEIEAEKLEMAKEAAIYLSLHSCEPQCSVELVLNDELILPFRLERVRQAYLDHLTELGKVREYILRRTIPLGLLRKGKNLIKFQARAPFLAQVLTDTLAEARAPGLDEVWFELRGEEPIE